MALSTKKVERLSRPGRYRDDKGLYLQISRAGGRSWIFRFEVGGREYAMGLGPVFDVTLEEAREAARVARGQLRQGINPLDAKRETRAANMIARANVKTFDEAATAYFEGHAAKWNDRVRKQLIKTVGQYTKSLARLPVDKIDVSHVVEVLQQPVPAYRSHPSGRLWVARARTARSLRQHIEAIMAYATVSKWRKGENPARWKGNIESLLIDTAPKAKNHASMPFFEAPAFLDVVRSKFTIRRRALEFTVLTACRTGEVLGARWSEVDLAAKTWTIPKERMKAGVAHAVPLSDRALQILKEVPHMKGVDYIFAGRGRAGRAGMVSARSLVTLMRELDRTETVHGYRATFKTWAGERTDTQPDIVELCLAHTVGSQVERAYARSTLLNKRRVLMEAWSKFCMQPPADIVPMMMRA